MLDNCEHVAEAAAALVSACWPAPRSDDPGHQPAAARRRRRTRHVVRPLPPDEEGVRAAAELFVDRAGAAGAHLPSTTDEVDACGSCAGGSTGSPWPSSWRRRAASRTTPSELVADVGDHLDRLADAHRRSIVIAPSRPPSSGPTTCSTTTSGSCSAPSRCSPAESLRTRSPPCSTSRWRTPTPPWRPGRALSSPRPDRAGTRYSMLEPLRQFARPLGAAGEADGATGGPRRVGGAWAARRRPRAARDLTRGLVGGRHEASWPTCRRPSVGASPMTKLLATLLWPRCTGTPTSTVPPRSTLGGRHRRTMVDGS